MACNIHMFMLNFIFKSIAFVSCYSSSIVSEFKIQKPVSNYIVCALEITIFPSLSLFYF